MPLKKCKGVIQIRDESFVNVSSQVLFTKDESRYASGNDGILISPDTRHHTRLLPHILYNQAVPKAAFGPRTVRIIKMTAMTPQRSGCGKHRQQYHCWCSYQQQLASIHAIHCSAKRTLLIEPNNSQSKKCLGYRE